MKILVFGNVLLKEDNLALRLMPKLKKEFPEILFKEFDPTESLEWEIEDGSLTILDVALGIDRVILVEDVEQLKLNNACSMHDCDLGFNLRMLKEIGELKKVRIICLPPNMNEDEVFFQLQSILRKWAAQDIQGS